MLAFLAGQTSRIGLGTSVMIVPHRNPLVAAKSIATLDVLSGGRVILGVGVGWLREEFEVLDLPPFDERGAVTDEYLRAFIELWTSDNPSFHGKYVQFDDISFLPKPVQKPHPPIWIGGESRPAIRRAAQLGNGWHPLGVNSLSPLSTVEQLQGRCSVWLPRPNVLAAIRPKSRSDSASPASTSLTAVPIPVAPASPETPSRWPRTYVPIKTSACPTWYSMLAASPVPVRPAPARSSKHWNSCPNRSGPRFSTPATRHRIPGQDDSKVIAPPGIPLAKVGEIPSAEKPGKCKLVLTDSPNDCRAVNLQ